MSVKKIISPRAGFTLVEIMVVVAIFAVLLTLGLINYRRGNDVQAINNASETLASALREVRTKALAGDRSGLGDAACPGPISGFGVYVIDSTHYTLFTDCDGDGAYTIPVPGGPDQEKIKTIALPNKTAFSTATADPVIIGRSFVFSATNGEYEPAVFKM